MLQSRSVCIVSITRVIGGLNQLRFVYTVDFGSRSGRKKERKKSTVIALHALDGWMDGSSIVSFGLQSIQARSRSIPSTGSSYHLLA